MPENEVIYNKISTLQGKKVAAKNNILCRGHLNVDVFKKAKKKKLINNFTLQRSSNFGYCSALHCSC